MIRYFVVFAAALGFQLHAQAVHGVISERIALDIGAVNVPASTREGSGEAAEISRMSFAMGRLSQEDAGVLHTVRQDGAGYQFTLSNGVVCQVSSADLKHGQWRPVPLNVPDVPRPERRSDGVILSLRPCVSP